MADHGHRDARRGADDPGVARPPTAVGRGATTGPAGGGHGSVVPRPHPGPRRRDPLRRRGVHQSRPTTISTTTGRWRPTSPPRRRCSLRRAPPWPWSTGTTPGAAGSSTGPMSRPWTFSMTEVSEPCTAPPADTSFTWRGRSRRAGPHRVVPRGQRPGRGHHGRRPRGPRGRHRHRSRPGPGPCPDASRWSTPPRRSRSPSTTPIRPDGLEGGARQRPAVGGGASCPVRVRVRRRPRSRQAPGHGRRGRRATPTSP